MVLGYKNNFSVEADLVVILGGVTIKFIFLYLIFRVFFENPLATIVLIVIVYAVIDRWYIGALPDFIKPLSRWRDIIKLKRELEFSPSQGQTLYQIGALQVESGNMKEGRRYLEKAHDLIPEHPDIEYYLGVARIKMGALESGKEALDNALKINPKIKYGFPYVYLIEYSLKRTEPREQIDAYMEKILAYENPKIYYNVGVIFQKAGYTEQAKEMFQKVQVSFSSSPSFLRKQQRYYVIMAKLRSLWQY
jgi:tetratricopeptide (TPR) repeat protein